MGPIQVECERIYREMSAYAASHGYDLQDRGGGFILVPVEPKKGDIYYAFKGSLSTEGSVVFDVVKKQALIGKSKWLRESESFWKIVDQYRMSADRVVGSLKAELPNINAYGIVRRIWRIVQFD